MKQENEPAQAKILTFVDADAFNDWLANNYQEKAGVWIKTAKVSSGIPSISSDECVDVGLCWGWISGQRKSLDENYYLQKYVPRRARSIWSQINVDKVNALTAAGKMQPSGIYEAEAAKADGRWSAAYAPQSSAVPPEDLLQALLGNKTAKHNFEKMSKAEQYLIIIKLAKVQATKTREDRIADVIKLLSR